MQENSPCISFSFMALMWLILYCFQAPGWLWGAVFGILILLEISAMLHT
jgi:hypothetical protein